MAWNGLGMGLCLVVRTRIGACVARDSLGLWLEVAETGERAVRGLGEVGGQPGEAGG